MSMFEREGLRFRCEGCGQLMLSPEVDVLKADISAKHDLPPGTCTRNLCYCIANPVCREVVEKMAEEAKEKR